MNEGHEVVAPTGLAPAVGFSHAVVAAQGRLVFLAGQTAQDEAGVIRGQGMTEQFDRALANLLTVLREAGGEPEHLVSLTVYVTDMDAYRQATRELGQVWRERFGRHYPAMALVEVTSLVDPAAVVEVQGMAVVA